MSKSETRQTGHDGDEQGSDSGLLFLGARRALIGGLIAGGIALGAQVMIGQIYSGAEARQLLEAIIPSARALGGGIVTASASILALMLTLLSLSHQTSSQFEALFFKRIQRIALFNTISLASSILLLLLMTMPFTESNNAPDAWYTVAYYAFIVIAAGLSGLFIAAVLMLYNAVEGIVRVLRPGVQAGIVADDGGQQSGPDESGQPSGGQSQGQHQHEKAPGEPGGGPGGTSRSV